MIDPFVLFVGFGLGIGLSFTIAFKIGGVSASYPLAVFLGGLLLILLRLL